MSELEEIAAHLIAAGWTQTSTPSDNFIAFEFDLIADEEAIIRDQKLAAKEVADWPQWMKNLRHY